MNSITPIRFFRVVSLHSPLLLFALGAVGIVTTSAVIMDPTAGAKAAVPVTFAQIVAASTGFAARARRGHLDLLLTGGPSRVSIALAHLAMSVAPGLATWLVVGMFEVAVSGAASAATLSSGSLVAMTVVSSLAWAATVPFPRLSGGIAWLFAMVTLFAMSPYARDALAAVTDAPPIMKSLLYLICPVRLVGRTLTVDDLPAVVPAIVLSTAAVIAALAWMVHVDVPLEASQ